MKPRRGVMFSVTPAEFKVLYESLGWYKNRCENPPPTTYKLADPELYVVGKEAPGHDSLDILDRVLEATSKGLSVFLDADWGEPWQLSFMLAQRGRILGEGSLSKETAQIIERLKERCGHGVGCQCHLCYLVADTPEEPPEEPEESAVQVSFIDILGKIFTALSTED